MKQEDGVQVRYSKSSPAISAEQTRILGTKKVCIAGCGGIGGYITETLARLGIGAITAVDCDTFEPSNLNRQLLALETNLGESKAEAACKRVQAVNSHVCVTAVRERLTSQNTAAIIRGHDLVLDALDSSESRLVLSRACAEEKVPLIHAAISGWSLQVCVVFPGDTTLEKLYATKSAPDAMTAGSLPITAMTAAALECAQAVRLLLGQTADLLQDGRVLSADLQNADFTVFSL